MWVYVWGEGNLDVGVSQGRRCSGCGCKSGKKVI